MGVSMPAADHRRWRSCRWRHGMSSELGPERARFRICDAHCRLHLEFLTRLPARSSSCRGWRTCRVAFARKPIFVSSERQASFGAWMASGEYVRGRRVHSLAANGQLRVQGSGILGNGNGCWYYRDHHLQCPHRRASTRGSEFRDAEQAPERFVERLGMGAAHGHIEQRPLPADQRLGCCRRQSHAIWDLQDFHVCRADGKQHCRWLVLRDRCPNHRSAIIHACLHAYAHENAQ